MYRLSFICDGGKIRDRSMHSRKLEYGVYKVGHGTV